MEKSSSQASSGHVLELQESYVEMHKTGVTHTGIKQSQKYSSHLIFNLQINSTCKSKENEDSDEIKFLADFATDCYQALYCCLLPKELH